MGCDEILQQGVFDTISFDSNRSLSANLLTWLASASYSEFKQKVDSGLRVGLPLEDVPFEIKDDYSVDELEKWKREYAAGKTRSFNEHEILQIVSRSVNKSIVDKWLECYRVTSGQGRTGLLSSIETGAGQDTAVFTARYLPTSINDLPPSVQSFQLSGATTNYPLIAGQLVPLAGVSVLLTRMSESDIVVVLNTDKGTVTERSSMPPILPSQMGLYVAYEPYFTPAGGAAGETFSLSITGPTRGLGQIESVIYRLNHKDMVVVPRPAEGPITAEFIRIPRFKIVTHTASVSANDPGSRFLAKTKEHSVFQIIASVQLRDGNVWQYEWKFPDRKP